jgi:outer membrane protein OmpA-like peptidoglycan-associated protein
MRGGWLLVIAACGRPAQPPPAPTQAVDWALIEPTTDAAPPPVVDAMAPGDDADGDMVLNECDRCPLDLEIYNGWEDDDGCTDRVHPYSQSGIFFEDESAELDARSLELLAHLAETLARNTGWERIAVVSRAAASETKPKVLSTRRAKAVIAALVAAGVDPARLKADPRGAEPLEDDGSDPELRARRTDLVLARENGVDLDVDEGHGLTLYLPIPRVAPPATPGCPLGPLTADA